MWKMFNKTTVPVTENESDTTPLKKGDGFWVVATMTGDGELSPALQNRFTILRLEVEEETNLKVVEGLAQACLALVKALRSSKTPFGYQVRYIQCHLSKMK